MQNEEGENIEPKKGVKKEGLLAGMSLFRKIILFLILLSIFLLAWNFIFGGISNIWELFFATVLFVFLSACAYIVIKAVQIYVQKGYFSPREDYFTAVVNLAIDLKPNNVRDLHFQGSRDKQRVKAGKILGILGIPYMIGEPELDDKGKMKYTKNEELGISLPKFKKILLGEDGDTLIVYEHGFLFPKRHFLRCDKKLHSELHGDVTVYDINPVPAGMFEYPFRQMQKGIGNIMVQSQLEIIIATQQHQQDYISQSADSAIYWNPYMKMIQEQKAELGGGE